jgi:transcription antitermination factor NusG
MKLTSAFSPAVMAELARPVASYDPRNAELKPGVTPKWHLIETYANCERKVASEMVARRFGIFVPESDEILVKRGRKIKRVQLMFPGYVFVFVWDVLEHRQRIEAIDGVLQLVLITSPTGPKPAELRDDAIDAIRAVENGERPLFEARSNRKRRGYSKRAFDNEVIAVHPWSAFQDRLLTLDSEGRNQTLRKALGLS